MSSWITITLDTSQSGLRVANSVIYANGGGVVDLYTIRDPFGETSRSGNPYFRIKDHPGENVLQTFLDNVSVPFSRYAVAEANDTSESADVSIYDVEHSGHELIDTIVGLDRANGADVEEEVWEQYRFDIVTS